MIIEVNDLTQGYYEKPVVHNISFSVSSGQLVSILGPNGSGKSTIIKTMCNIMDPKEGSIELNGADIHDIPRKEFAKHVAYVPQSSSVFGYTSVYDTVLAGRRPYIDWDYGSEDIRIAADAMRTMGVDDLHGKMLNDLSGGQKQRVHIARALAQNSEMFILDEPTSALDLHHQLETMKIMRTLCNIRGHGAVIALHDLNLAMNYSDKVVVLANGTVYDQGKPEDVITEEMIEKVYSVHSRIVDDEHGRYIHPYDTELDKTRLDMLI